MYMMYSTDLIFKRNKSDRTTHDAMSIMTHDVNDTYSTREKTNRRKPIANGNHTNHKNIS